LTSEVVAIGRINIDISMKVDRLPRQPSHIITEDGFISVGGSAANYAMQSNKLGVKTGLVSCIGNDAYGQIAMKEISKEGIDTKGILVLDKQRTGLFFMANEKSGARMIFANPGANKFLDKHTLDDSYVSRAVVLHVAGGFPMMISMVAEKATTDGVIFSFDPGRTGGSIDFSKILRNVDLLFINTHELKEYFKITPTKTNLKKLAKTFPGILILKRGKKGAEATDGFEYCTSQAFEVPVVDTLGSGDAFAAGFVTAWTRSENIEKALHFGNAAAALTITQQGAQNGQGTLDEIAAFMKKHGINISEILRTFRTTKRHRKSSSR
jgi:ribokinase